MAATSFRCSEAQRSARRTCQRIAAELKSMWTKPLSDDHGMKRALRAGDVLVLVRSRGPLFDSIIREIKFAGLPISALTAESY